MKREPFDVYVPFWRDDWHGEMATCCGYTKTQAWDAAIAMYDEGIAPNGYPFEKDRASKIRFLKRRGLKLKLATIVIKE